jgi:hypothetical protein
MSNMSKAEIRRYLASIGSKGGKAGTGASKLRGGKEYYMRISKLAAKARKARRGNTSSTTNTGQGAK